MTATALPALATNYRAIEAHRQITGLPRTWHAALVHIATTAPTMSQLSQAIGIQKAAVTALVDNLERFQLAERVPGENRRTTRITPQGLSTLTRGKA